MTVQEARELAKKLVKELTGKSNKAKEDAAALVILEATPPTSTWYPIYQPWYTTTGYSAPDWTTCAITCSSSSEEEK